ncbi:MAG: polysaccharide deacetylase family protein [Polyangiales bacterium]
MRLSFALVAMFVGACAAPPDDSYFFTYDDRQLLCGLPLDDYLVPERWDRLLEHIDTAAREGWVLNVYAHAPGISINIPTLERALSMIDGAGLPYLTYRDLDPDAEPRPGVVFSFDDNGVDSWLSVRSLLHRHAVRATLFVSNFHELDAKQRAALHVLEDDGHEIESHTVHHLEAALYAGEHGAQAWLDDEVLPEIEMLRADGFSPESFAYPYGSRTAETDAVLAPHVRWIRTTPGTCDR